MKKKTSFFLIAFLVLISNMARSQNQHRIDSLLLVISAASDDKNKFDAYKNLCKEYYRTDLDKAEYYNQKALKIALQLDDLSKIAVTLFNKGSLLKMRGKYDSSLVLIHQAQDYFHQISDTMGYADCLSEAGNLYLLKKDFKNSFVQLMEALRVYRSTLKEDEFAHIYNQIGMMYRVQKQYDSTLKYYNLSLEINERIGFKLGSSVNLLNIGTVYENLKDYSTAISYYRKSHILKEELDDKKGMMKCMTNIGNAYNSLRDFKNAISYHEKALALANEYKSSLEIATCLINLGNDYQRDQSFSKAVLYAMEGHNLAKQVNDLELLRESSRILAESNKQLRNFQDAYHYHELYKHFSDSIVKQNNLTELAEVQAQYENVKRENEITNLKINKERQELKIQRLLGNIYLFIGLFVALLALAFFFYYRYLTSKKVSVKLREINEMKSRFFANLSHEFRTPLTLMLGPAEKLLYSALPNDKPWLELIIRNARRLLFLDEQLLEFTKIDSGTLVLRLVEGDILLPLKAVAGSFELLAQNKSINYIKKFPQQEIMTVFDADILEKSVTNLLSNAFKYTPFGGTITIEAGFFYPEVQEKGIETENKSKTGHFRIDIRDTGIGIPEDMIDKIFERFYRLNNVTGNPVEGTGIGLALTRELVQLHHGRVLVDSASGQGSLFSIFLPVDKQAYSDTELKELKTYTHNPEPPEGKMVAIGQPAVSFPTPGINYEQGISANVSPYLLIVDDNEDMRMYLSEIVGGHYPVKLARDGSEGFEIASTIIPDLIITDVMMQPVNGIEFCRQLKTDVRTSHIPVIMLTALAGAEEKIKGLETGADDYLAKPFKIQELLVRINNLIIQRKNLRELFVKTVKIAPKDISVTSADEKFLNKIIQLVDTNIDNAEMEVDFLVKNIGMSRSQLHRKITALTGQPISGFIRIIRIRRAAQLMEQGFGNVSEIMHEVGFSNLSYFSKCFKEEFNMTPTEFMTK